MECSGGLGVFGEARTATNRRRPSAAVEDEDDGVEAKQSFPRGLARWGGRGGRGGAPDLSGRARGGRWLWMRRRRPPVALGGAPKREGERARASRERDSGRGRLRGVVRGLGEEAGGDQGKQEVAHAAASRCLSSWQGGRRQGGWRWAGLARWAWWAAEVSPGEISLLCLLFLFFFIFCSLF